MSLLEVKFLLLFLSAELELALRVSHTTILNKNIKDEVFLAIMSLLVLLYANLSLHDLLYSKI